MKAIKYIKDENGLKYGVAVAVRDELGLRLVYPAVIGSVIVSLKRGRSN